MVHLSAFDYHPGKSFLHHLDMRFKLILMLVANLSLTRADWSGLIAVSMFSTLLALMLRIPFLRLLIEIRLFLLLLAFVFIARSVSVADGQPLFDAWKAFTREGLISGVMICWRLLLVVLIGLFFMRTSRTWGVKAAIEWFLRPLPGESSKRIALMLSLMLRFLPMILELAGEISEAQQARLIGLRKNPLYRIKMQIIPLLVESFHKADQFVTAMEARCYSDSRTAPALHAERRDWIILIAFSGFLLMVASA